MAERPRAVLVTRPTELDAALARHATLGQARFFLEARGHSVGVLQQRRQAQDDAVAAVARNTPDDWRRARVDRADLDRFLFEPHDVVVVVGQDGLVANVAKYLGGQPVIGVNPDPARYDGVLVRHAPDTVAAALAAAALGSSDVEERTMVEAAVDDGQRLMALNEVFFGHRTHQSARYVIRVDGAEERQSSSGVIVATGTGATGWARSIAEVRRSGLALPAPTDRTLAFFVREPFPSVFTGTSVTEGRLPGGGELALECELTEGGVVFGDGIEQDRIDLAWGQRVIIRTAEQALRLVVG